MRGSSSRDLAKLGYKFTEDGHLVSTETGEKYQFVNQELYDELSLAVQQFLADTLALKYNCVPVHLPLPGDQLSKFDKNDMAPSSPHTTVYLSENAYKVDKLLLVIQGSGSVRPGQWSRSATINGSLEGYLIINPNNNKFRTSRGEVSIPGSDTPEHHAMYCWEHIVEALPAKRVDIVAHSYGGMCTLALLQKFEKSFVEKVSKIGFTDAVHSVAFFPKVNKEWLHAHAINWVESNLPLDSEARKPQSGCPCFSSGHAKHEYTSFAAMKSVFRWLGEGVAPKI